MSPYRVPKCLFQILIRWGRPVLRYRAWYVRLAKGQCWRRLPGGDFCQSHQRSVCCERQRVHWFSSIGPYRNCRGSCLFEPTGRLSVRWMPFVRLNPEDDNCRVRFQKRSSPKTSWQCLLLMSLPSLLPSSSSPLLQVVRWAGLRTATTSRMHLVLYQ